ncbi:Aste57867_17142 [Aphanomyces stellatus]|uniref:Protein phosphatase methylesterase 1 n=1 Tax=Aphanomyces stellatus TaxID=120398 RepID=A0A485L805_9STRA|nr:hypothetical protein As57867_017083 [Aphanomyces stellatus]VFT93899.1 Aste57867_17142 [Aphanomyces stellatus]
MSKHNCSLWMQYFDRSEDVDVEGDVFRVYFAGSQGPWVVLLHGGGHTALTWCLTTAILKNHCRVLAFDFRGHGMSKTRNEGNLSESILVQDTINILNHCLSDETSPNSRAPVILVGHSMGGAIAIRVAATNLLQNLTGVVVIDVVEGTALAALSHMQAVLSSRPTHFSSEDEAIQWSLQSGNLRNAESAKVSIPSQVRLSSDGSLVWRTDLFASAQYWTGWFTGISELFLSISAPKVLLLAGTDRLDTALTRGQMQGKFQLLLMYGSGHVIQEDCPEKTANMLLEFCSRLGTISGVKNQAEILAEKLAKARGMMPQR